jgi:hypothetical protein
MGCAVLVEELRAELAAALKSVPQDRWLLGRLRAGRLWVVCDSARPSRQPFSRCSRVSPLARRCLHERLPLTVTSLCEHCEGQPHRDWEIDWPALVYVPVARRRHRAEGLLVVGSRRPRRFDQAEVDFLADLGEVIAPWLDGLGPQAPAGRALEFAA